MGIGLSVFSRENEFDVQVKPQKGFRGWVPTPDEAILEMLVELYRNCKAAPFGLAGHRVSKDAAFDPVAFVVYGVMPESGERCHREEAGAYLEISQPFYTDPFQFCLGIRRAEQIADFVSRRVSKEGFSVRCFNAVSDRKGREAKSCGMHNNHLVDRSSFEGIMAYRSLSRLLKYGQIEFLTRKAQDLISWIVLRIIIIGAGKIGSDLNSPPAVYQISERSDFIEKVLGSSTMMRRPLLNDRDEPHADWREFARLHLINGEGNRSPWASILGMGFESMFIEALCDDAVKLEWFLLNPVKTIKSLSRDVRLERDIPVIRRSDDATLMKKPLELFGDIFTQVSKHHYSRAESRTWCDQILGETEKVIAALAQGDPEGLASSMLDWCIKRKFLEEIMREKLRLDPDRSDSWDHPVIRGYDLAYHKITGDDELFSIIDRTVDGIRDFGKYRFPYGVPEEDSFWKVGGPADNRSFLLSLIASDPDLQKNFSISDWGEIKFVSKDSPEVVYFRLDDPRRFTRKDVESFCGGDLGFKPDKLLSFLRSQARIMKVVIPEDENCLPKKLVCGDANDTTLQVRDSVSIGFKALKRILEPPE